MDVVASSARQALSVLLVFGLLGLTLWKLRKGGNAVWSKAAWTKAAWSRAEKKTRTLEAAERLALTPQHSLHLIRVQGREILVATHPQGCTVIEVQS